jgi:protein-S-isoprenylcysteine O-methyltransferase Ste14
MPANERSFSQILQDIVHNIQEIVRSEIRLARTEITQEATKTKTAGVVIAAGALSGVFALLFALLAVDYALSLAMPNWAAALIVSAALAIIAGAMLSAGRKRFKHVHPAPERTIVSMKENVAWLRLQNK